MNRHAKQEDWSRDQIAQSAEELTPEDFSGARLPSSESPEPRPKRKNRSREAGCDLTPDIVSIIKRAWQVLGKSETVLAILPEKFRPAASATIRQIECERRCGNAKAAICEVCPYNQPLDMNREI